MRGETSEQPFKIDCHFRLSILIATCPIHEYSIRWMDIAPGRVHILTASPHLGTSAAVDGRMPLIE
jgi:hypothetical protein